MSKIFPRLKSLWSDQVCLEVSPKQLEQTWPSQQEYSYDVARWTAYKNRLTLDAFLDWLQAESGIEEQPQVLPSRDDLSSIWEVVNGTAIEIGGTRIVLIPEAMDTDEYEVQAEWVDIPSWAADYYLAVQVNPDEGWLRIWGYTTHKKLKQVGQYNSIRRTYSLKREELIEDLNVMWVARKLGCDCKAAIKPLPTLSPVQAEKLLQQLSQKTPYSPRLEVPFEQWAALLDNDRWRQDLYNRRLGRFVPVAAPSKVRVNLSQWFQNIYEAGWQTVEEILSTLGTPQANLAYSFRSADCELKISPSTPNAIPALIELLRSHRDKTTRLQAADLLGRIAPTDAITALSELLHTTKDDDTRRQFAVCLGKIAPGNPAAGVERAKVFDLGLLLDGHQVTLVVTLLPEADRRSNINFRVYPTGKQTYLPPNIQLIVLDESGTIFLETKSERADNWIQLRFRGSPGDCFSVKVALGDASVKEDFVI